MSPISPISPKTLHLNPVNPISPVTKSYTLLKRLPELHAFGVSGRECVLETAPRAPRILAGPRLSPERANLTDGCVIRVQDSGLRI